MSSAIQFLETMGRNPVLIHRAAEAYAEAVWALQVDDAQRHALLDRNPDVLGGLLDGRTNMLCLVAVPNEEEQESTPDDADGDGVPDQDEPIPTND